MVASGACRVHLDPTAAHHGRMAQPPFSNGRTANVAQTDHEVLLHPIS
jgi:hypothetical protein